MTLPVRGDARALYFRLLALGIPIVLGGATLLIILYWQGWVTLREGRLAFQRPPLYLQEPGYEVTGHRYLYDELLGWRNIPEWKSTTFGQPLTINKAGFRDKEYSVAKPPSTNRIMVLGDSYAWGYGVGDDAIFTEGLETLLGAQQATWEVINTGVSGWGTDQEFLFLKEKGLGYAPDIVVVAFFIGNDIDNNLAATQYTLHKPVFVGETLSPSNVPVPRPGQRVNPRLAAKIGQQDGVALTVRILAAMRDLCADHGCEFVVMKFGIFLAPELPYAKVLEQQFEQRLRDVQPRLRYLDLDRVFRERQLNAQALTEGVDDGHWNAFGHTQVAEALQAFFIDQGMVE